MPARNKRRDRELDEPAVCDLLPIRDYLAAAWRHTAPKRQRPHAHEDEDDAIFA